MFIESERFRSLIKATSRLVAGLGFSVGCVTQPSARTPLVCFGEHEGGKSQIQLLDKKLPEHGRYLLHLDPEILSAGQIFRAITQGEGCPRMQLSLSYNHPPDEPDAGIILIQGFLFPTKRTLWPSVWMGVVATVYREDLQEGHVLSVGWRDWEINNMTLDDYSVDFQKIKLEAP